MCCWTHGYRDDLALKCGETLDLVDADDPFRCQCTIGVPCRRRATEEDRQCDWCRGQDHAKACDQMGMPPVRNGAITSLSPPARSTPTRYGPGLIR